MPHMILRCWRYVLLLTLPAGVQASYFEFCELEGTITAIPLQSSMSPRAVPVTLHVESVRQRRDRELRLDSYSDCTGYVGTAVTFELELPRSTRKASLRVGDRLSVLRSVYDGGTGGTTAIKFISHRAVPAERP